jgi:hypothetical protein
VVLHLPKVPLSLLLSLAALLTRSFSSHRAPPGEVAAAADLLGIRLEGLRQVKQEAAERPGKRKMVEEAVPEEGSLEEAVAHSISAPSTRRWTRFSPRRESQSMRTCQILSRPPRPASLSHLGRRWAPTSSLRRPS